MIETKLAQFVLCITSYCSRLSMLQISTKKIEILHDFLNLNCVLFSPSYSNFMALKHQHEFRVLCLSVAGIFAFLPEELWP